MEAAWTEVNRLKHSKKTIKSMEGTSTATIGFGGDTFNFNLMKIGMDQAWTEVERFKYSKILHYGCGTQHCSINSLLEDLPGPGNHANTESLEWIKLDRSK